MAAAENGPRGEDAANVPVRGGMFPFKGYVIDGKYVLDDGIVVGDVATLYRCRKVENNDAHYALKMLDDPRTLANEDVLGRFEEEGNWLLEFAHHNIIKCTDCGVWEQGCVRYPYLVMEYVQGAIPLDTERIPIEMVLEIGEDVASALEYMHRGSRIHRDIKPENILRSRSGDVTKIIGFGLGLALKKSDRKRKDTAPGVIIGTPNYMPLEQSMSSREANPKSDVYSLGATVFKLLTGHVPFRERGGDANVIRAIWSKERIPAPREVEPSVPEDVSDFVYEMTDPEHTKRPDASEARHTFRKYRDAAA